jgi:hypothetical protein
MVLAKISEEPYVATCINGGYGSSTRQTLASGPYASAMASCGSEPPELHPSFSLLYSEADMVLWHGRESTISAKMPRPLSHKVSQKAERRTPDRPGGELGLRKPKKEQQR